MQIFVPYPDLKQSVCCLDKSRLGNQCWRECLTLIRGGWRHHTVAKIWADHKHAIAQYALYGFEELARRGKSYPHHVQTFTNYLKEFPDTGLPPIFGYEPFHSAMRSNLLRKLPEYYSQFGWTEPNDLPYIYKL